MNEALSGLLELPLPAPVSYVPQTAGWYVLLVLALLSIAIAMYRWFRRRAANRYRREALVELDRIEQAADAESLNRLPALVKRAALASAPRDRVANLSGAAWLEFLNSTLPGSDFTSGAGLLLPELSYASPERLAAIPKDQIADLISLVRRWIRGHDARL